jgi:hypothetical protein
MDELKEIVIPKENAVFWMDGNGRWHNVHGPFQHKKVIDYFNRSIGWDADGFFVSQERNDVYEKVYFRYEETALFGVETVIGTEISILLNNRDKVKLDPHDLYIKTDHLFMNYQDTIIKFADRCLMRLSEYIEEIDGVYYFQFNGKKDKILTMDEVF